MYKKLILSLVFLCFVGINSAHAEKGGHRILVMSPDNISTMVEGTKGKKRVLLILEPDCEKCHKKFVDVSRFEKTKREAVTTIFFSNRKIDFVRYMNHFKDVPIKVIYNEGSQWELVQSLKQYGVKPWKTLPRVILLDENNKVFGQGDHSAEKIDIFLSGKVQN